MNCFFHPEEAAAVNCVDCGKGLCKGCAEKYKIAICDECNLKRNKADKKVAIKKLIPSIILFAIGFISGFIVFGLPGASGEIVSFPEKFIAGIIFGWALAGFV